MAQAKELHELLDRVNPADAHLVRALLERLAIPYDDEPLSPEDIESIEYSMAHPEDRISHDEILREFGLADPTPVDK